MPKKRRYDLREFWPWYERSWHTRGGHATPPPFTLNDISHERPMKGRRAFRVLLITLAIVVVAVMLWGLVH